jgi:hypothetical protein
MPQRIRTGWDDPPPRTTTPAVPWPTGHTPAPSPALAITAPHPVVPDAGAPLAPSATEPGPLPPDLPGVGSWDSAPGVGEMERALRSVPLGLEPVPTPVPRVQTPPAVAATSRATPAGDSVPPPLHRPPTPPSVPVALEAGEESPLAVAARGATLARPSPGRWSRRLFVTGVVVLLAAFIGTTAWVRSGAPPRPLARSPAVPVGPVIETEVDRLLTRAMRRIDAHDEGGAEEAAMRAAVVDPSDPRAYLLLGRIHLRTGKPERARMELSRVLDLEASGPRAEEARALLSTFP